MTAKRPRAMLGVAVCVSGVVFLVLLGVRLQVFDGPQAGRAFQARELPARDTWMSIRQEERRIGYAHRRMAPRADGYDLRDTTFMRITTMGLAMDLHLDTRASLNPDWSLAEFSFSLASARFAFTAAGRVADGELRVTINGQDSRIPLDGPVFLAGSVIEAATDDELAVGQSRAYQVFDPATLSRRPVTVTYEGDEVLTVMGRRENTRRLAVEFMGTSQTAWIAADGRVVREAGLLGLTLTQVAEADALTGISAQGSRDLTRLASVPLEAPIHEPTALTRLTLRLEGVSGLRDLDGDRQELAGDRLTITRERLPERRTASHPPPGDAFLSATPLMEVDHPEIRAVVDRIMTAADTPLQRVRKIMAWIGRNIDKRPVVSVPSALATLHNRVGDCNEHAVLMAALCRAAGVPAQVEAGLVHLDGRLYYHAWNVVWLGAWVTIDALMGQLPADVTHIRLVRGDLDRQVDLMALIGRLAVTVVDQR